MIAKDSDNLSPEGKISKGTTFITVNLLYLDLPSRNQEIFVLFC